MYNCIICYKDIFRDVPKTKNGNYKPRYLKKIHKEIMNEDIKIKPKTCYKCLEEKLGYKIVRGLSNKARSIMYNIPIEETKGMTNNGVTLDKQIKKYGLKEGTRRFNSYCKKQSLSNTFEYKKEKYNMTNDEFRLFNNSRAVTLGNQIKKYGLKEGTKRFNSYCKKQQTAGISLLYFQNKYGKEEGSLIYKKVNKSKANNIENFIKKYGEKEGKIKFNSYIKKQVGFYSKESILFFEKELSSILIKYKTYYKDTEYGLMDVKNNTYYKYDLVIPELKICIEYNGDLFHANPSKYNELDKPNPFSNSTSKEIWDRDRIKQELIESKGYKVIVIWSSESIEDKRNKIKGLE